MKLELRGTSNTMPNLFYWQKLPHFFPPGSTYFITYRLAGSVPKEKIAALEAERDAALRQSANKKAEHTTAENEHIINDFFEKADFCVDTNLNEPYWLKDEKLAKTVADSLLYLSDTAINLWAFCIMPNHVHILFDLKDEKQDAVKIMQQHKSFTAKVCNRLLERNGQFWERESYDHVVRNGKFDTIVNYIINNPVKAGFVNDWQKWPWTYLHPDLL